jgi:hypothetical protein
MTPENAVETLRRHAQTSKRVAAMRQRRAAQGLVRVEVYVHPDDAVTIKALAARLQQQRQSKPG